MRYLVAIFILITGIMASHAPAAAALPNAGEFSSLDGVGRFISNYRVKPNPGRVPAAVKALAHLGAFKDADSAGVYVGFIAGVIGSNPVRAEDLIAKMLPLPPPDQWLLVRAIAYSGHPDWRGLLSKFSDRLPLRKVMIDKYLDGTLQTLDEVALEKKSPTLWEKMRGTFRSNKDEKRVIVMTYDKSPELLDTLWGYYFATGSYGPISRIVNLLPWANDRDSTDRLTIGSMAKYTLASNAARDPALLAMIKAASKNQPKETGTVLAEVIEAAETMETTRLRKDALANLEELKRKGPGYKRDVSTWGKIGTGALALGCIAAAATGQVYMGLPCVIGGAASSAALNYWDTQ
jgi:hypothetical protein